MSSAIMADDVEQVRQHLGLETIDLLGHSNGGAIAISLAARYPKSCRKLVLVDSQLIGFSATEATDAILSAWADDPRYRDSVSAAKMAPTYEDAAFTGWLQSFLPLYFYDPERFMQSFVETIDLPIAAWAAWRQDLADEGGENNQTRMLGQIEAETLVVVGRHDFVTPVQVSERLREGIRKSRFAVLERCGHMPWIEQTSGFFSEVQAFLKA